MRIGVVMNKDSSTLGRRVNEESSAVFVESGLPVDVDSKKVQR